MSNKPKSVEEIVEIGTKVVYEGDALEHILSKE